MPHFMLLLYDDPSGWERLSPEEMQKATEKYMAQQIRLDAYLEVRPYRWALVGLWSYYGLLLLSVGGFVVLVRRRVTSLPLVAITLTVVATMAIAFGCTRYRTPFEVVLAVLASVAVDGLVNVVRRARPETKGARGGPGPTTEDAPEGVDAVAP